LDAGQCLQRLDRAIQAASKFGGLGLAQANEEQRSKCTLSDESDLRSLGGRAQIIPEYLPLIVDALPQI
jgi:hypothetical protein